MVLSGGRRYKQRQAQKAEDRQKAFEAVFSDPELDLEEVAAEVCISAGAQSAADGQPAAVGCLHCQLPQRRSATSSVYTARDSFQVPWFGHFAMLRWVLVLDGRIRRRWDSGCLENSPGRGSATHRSPASFRPNQALSSAAVHCSDIAMHMAVEGCDRDHDAPFTWSGLIWTAPSTRRDSKSMIPVSGSVDASRGLQFLCNQLFP
jgi:hypothetical protein